MFSESDSFFILLCIFLCLREVLAANIPSPVTHMWQTVAKEIYEKSLEQWARSPLDEKGEWAEWLFPTQDQDEGPATINQSIEDPPIPDLVPDLVPDIEITPYMADATDFYVNEDVSSFGLNHLYRSPTPVQQQPSPRHIPILPSQPRSRSPSSSSRSSALPKGLPPKRISKLNDPNRKYVCHVCGHRFDRETHVERHVRSIHTKEKPFVCKVCGWGFTRRDNFGVHVRDIHPNGR